MDKRHLFTTLLLCAVLLSGPFGTARVTATKAAQEIGPNAILNPSTVIDVNSTADVVADDGICTLREAITAANTDTQSGITLGECAAGSGPDIINLDPGIYTLAIDVPGPPEDGNAAGDLDITSDLTISGAGTGSTIIQAGSSAPVGIDRVLHVVGPNATVMLDDLTLRNGNETATGLGGAAKIENTNEVSILNCSISGSRTLLFGGGIHNLGVLNILNSTISGNHAASGGGILNAVPSGLLNIANSTVSGNTAFIDGGGILNNSLAGAYLTNVTITRNVADSDNNGSGGGGGISNAAPPVINLKSNIIAGNFDTPGNAGPGASDPDINETLLSATFVSLGYNLIGSVGTAVFASNTTGDHYGDPLGTTTPNAGATESATPINPLLGSPLGNPAYHPLLTGSPAPDTIPAAVCTFISGGSNPLFTSGAVVTDDQVGTSRPQPVGGNCDKGAYEAHAWTFLVNTTADTSDAKPGDEVCADASGACSLRAAIDEANTLAGGPDLIDVGVGTFTLTLAGAGEDNNATGDLDIRASMVISGAGLGSTFIEAGATPATSIDRVFHIPIAGTDVVLHDMTIRNGSVNGDGGGINNSGVLTLDDTVAGRNQASDDGGGVYNGDDGIMTISDSTIVSNQSTGSTGSHGGGLDNRGAITITNSTIFGNTALGVGGGANHMGSVLTVISSTINANASQISTFGGGGIYSEGRVANIANTTISGNDAYNGGGGYYHADGTSNLTNVTITGNAADADNSGGGDGGGIAVVSGSAFVTNTIVAGNIDNGSTDPTAENPDCSGALTSNGNNVFGDNIDCPAGASDLDLVTLGLNVADALDTALLNNGGDTKTHDLVTNSPAIDAANPSACAAWPVNNIDQRGFTRPLDGDGDGSVVCDIGAVEFFSPDLMIVKTAYPHALFPDQPVTYTLTFSNTGVQIATSVVITDLVPGVLTDPAIVDSSGATITPTPGVTFSWQVADLAPGQGGVITLTGLMTTGLTGRNLVTNTAVITSAVKDGNPRDNSDAIAVLAISPSTPLLYGASTGSSDGGGSGTGESSLYVIDKTTGTAYVIGPTGFENVTGMVFLPDGRLVASARGDDLFGSTPTAILIEIDRFTGAGRLIGVIGDINTSCGRMPDLTYDQANDTLYGYGNSCTGGPEGLYKVDPLTGAGTPVGASGYTGAGNGLAIDAATGVIYATPDDNQSLVTLNPVTGAGADVPGSAGNVPDRVNALDFDPESGDLYGSWNVRAGGAVLVTIATADGTTTRIGPTITGLDAIAFFEPRPTIAMAPLSLSGTQAIDTAVNHTLTISNEGELQLSWAFTETLAVLHLSTVVPPVEAAHGSALEGNLTDYANSAPLQLDSGSVMAPAGPARYAGMSGLLYYGDRTAFDSDFPGLPLEDFEEGNVSAGAIKQCPAPLDSSSNNTCFTPGDILDGVRFQDNPGPDSDGLALLGVGALGNTSKNIVTNKFPESFDIHFTELVFAAGMDLVSYPASDTVNITVYGPGDVVWGTTTATATNQGAFWGVASTQPIVRINLDAVTDQSEGVDNMVFGAAPRCGVPWASTDPITGTTSPGDGTDVTVTFDATGLSGGVYTGTLCVESNDPLTPFTTVPLTMTVDPDADLWITKSAPSIVATATVFTYTLDYGNLGPAPAFSVTLTDTLPTGVNLVDVSDPACTETGGLITCDLGDLASGASGTIYVQATAPTKDTYANQAGITSSSPDPEGNNNSADATVEAVDVLADLWLTKSAPAAATIRTVFTYTLAYGNLGPSTAFAVTLTDTLPTGVNLVDVSDPACTETGGLITCDLGDLVSGASGTIYVQATAPTKDTYVNQAGITSSSPDPDGNNNGANAAVEVVDLKVYLPLILSQGR